MSTSERKVSEHYSIDALETQILSALEATGKDLEALTVDDLAPVDAFHIRGRTATEELARWAELRPEHVLLDVGCGLGGTSRYLTSIFGCQVVGVDLTQEYCQVAEMLSARVGLADRTVFRQGNALALPFSDDHFDVVWTEHVQMNIADKAGFYSELRRVLKAGGQLVFHEILAGVRGGLHLPVPWAADTSISHLISENDLQTLLADLDFETVRWEDQTDASVAFFRTAAERVRNEGWMPLGVHLLMGNDAAAKMRNVLRNLEEDRVRVVQAVMKRVP
jgi:SAM-dependent methyltransferase